MRREGDLAGRGRLLSASRGAGPAHGAPSGECGDRGAGSAGQVKYPGPGTGALFGFGGGERGGCGRRAALPGLQYYPALRPPRLRAGSQPGCVSAKSQRETSAWLAEAPPERPRYYRTPAPLPRALPPPVAPPSSAPTPCLSPEAWDFGVLPSTPSPRVRSSHAPAPRKEGLARILGTSWDAETCLNRPPSAAGSWESLLGSLSHVAGRQRTCCAF